MPTSFRRYAPEQELLLSSSPQRMAAIGSFGLFHQRSGGGAGGGCGVLGIGSDNFPSRRSLCDFRREHLSDFRAIFVQVVQIARESGLVSLGKVAIDGTKVKANASKHKAMSYGRMEAAQREADQGRGRHRDDERKATSRVDRVGS